MQKKLAIYTLFLLFPLSSFAHEEIKKEPTHFLIVRHAETFRNAEGKQIQGWIDDEQSQLNAKGKTQADELGKRLAEKYFTKITALYTSPLGRCKETASRIGQYFPKLALIEEERFKEICHGQHDAMSFKERNEFCLVRYQQIEQESKQPGRFFKWEINPLSERPIPEERIQNPLSGELETVLQVFKRATSALKDIAEEHPGETILISSHAAVIKTLADEAEYRERGDKRPLPVYYEPKAPDEPKSRLLPGNCVVYHFIWENENLKFIGSEDLLAN